MLSAAKHQPTWQRRYYVYIMSNVARTLYVGITNDLLRRLLEHKRKHAHGFTAKHDVTSLVYCESTRYVLNAIQREKQLKGWSRNRKLALIESVNPSWRDLSDDWPELADPLEFRPRRVGAAPARNDLS